MDGEIECDGAVAAAGVGECLGVNSAAGIGFGIESIIFTSRFIQGGTGV